MMFAQSSIYIKKPKFSEISLSTAHVLEWQKLIVCCVVIVVCLIRTMSSVAMVVQHPECKIVFLTRKGSVNTVTASA